MNACAFSSVREATPTSTEFGESRIDFQFLRPIFAVLTMPQRHCLAATALVFLASSLIFPNL